MPQHSRPRDGHRERAWNDHIRERDRHEDRSRYRHHRYSEDEEENYDDDDVFDDDNRRRRRRTYRSSHSRPRGAYAPHDDVYDNDDDIEDDGNVIVVDSRPNFARPPNVRPSPVRGPPDPRSRERSRHHKAKESPATSPIKKRDRERDREGRRRRDSTADEDSPTKGRVRDRRTRDRDRERERDRGGGGGISDRERRRDRRREKEKHTSADSANSATHLLSTDALSKFNAKQQKVDAAERAAERARAEKEEKARAKKEARRKKEYLVNEKARGRESSRERDKRKAAKRRLVSGALLEEGRSPELNKRGGGGKGRRKEERWRKGGGGGDGDDSGDEGGGCCGGWFRNWSKKKKIWVALGVLALLLVIIIPVAAVVAGKKGDAGGGDGSTSNSAVTGDKSALDGISRSSIPKKAQGTVLDPWTWYETKDFNVTYTDETVGGLSVMGLMSKWDDSARANDNVPPLNEDFPYGKQPIRGVNVGGWLSIEPFIAPSLFSQFNSRDGVVDECTLCQKLGSTAPSTLEKHYATFITDQSFKEIRDAGLDHVRIPFSYWAVKTYDGDPYVAQVSWKYLLRAIEYCRKYGLRIKLDLHGLPGSQNGWNHSGHQGPIGWLNGTDGDLNAQRAQEIHSQLSTFFAQDRYKNIVTIYGLANEPMMLELDIESVLNWNTETIKKIRGNGFKQYIAFGDGFLMLSKWKTMMQDVDDRLLIDTHQYTIFNTGQIGIDHKGKIDVACDAKDGWVNLISGSNSGDNGWGPTICGEWSQADTDCAQYLNNVNTGSRWTGTLSGPDTKSQALDPLCPTAKSGPPCSCTQANADPSDYSDDYKKFLQTYAEAQMYAFEKGYGWFYWTWDTESAVQWSYKKALAAGTLPAKAYQPAFKCGDTVPSFGDLPDYY